MALVIVASRANNCISYRTDSIEAESCRRRLVPELRLMIWREQIEDVPVLYVDQVVGLVHLACFLDSNDTATGIVVYEDSRSLWCLSNPSDRSSCHTTEAQQTQDVPCSIAWSPDGRDSRTRTPIKLGLAKLIVVLGNRFCSKYRRNVRRRYLPYAKEKRTSCTLPTVPVKEVDGSHCCNRKAAVVEIKPQLPYTCLTVWATEHNLSGRKVARLEIATVTFRGSKNRHLR